MSSQWLEARGMPWCFREDSRRLAETGKPFVINLDDKGSVGTHWVAARQIGDTLYYADPFGTVLSGYPPKELLLEGVKVVANSIDWQRPKTNYCGYFAYRFAKAMGALQKGSTKADLERQLWLSVK